MQISLKSGTLTHAEFLKTLFLRENFCGQESERGVNSILTTICVFDQLPEKIELFAWWQLLRLVERIIFKKKLSKTEEEPF